ncbi:MAG: CYTH domain-containing protein [Anaerovibrio sp.]|nr:CYTH domain-containing protein [Anaerovibrio sp.]
MAKEIERKFLIKRELWQPQRPGVEIRQGYLSLDPERTVRVRTKGAKGYLTIKGKNQGISRTELEYEIPYEEASQMLEELCLHPLVEKTRYLEQHGQQLWEIDIFAGDNEGLAVAEAELSSEDTALVLPIWIDREVSGEARYYNSSLTRLPYKNW